MWTDCLAVLASSGQQALAMDFINYLLDEEVALATSQRLLFAQPIAMFDRLPAEIRTNTAVYPPVICLPEWVAGRCAGPFAIMIEPGLS